VVRLVVRFVSSHFAEYLTVMNTVQFSELSIGSLFRFACDVRLFGTGAYVYRRLGPDIYRNVIDEKYIGVFESELFDFKFSETTENLTESGKKVVPFCFPRLAHETKRELDHLQLVLR